MTLHIGSREVGPGHPCLVVAESGINHGGSVETALEMVRAAKRAGADAFKVAAITASDFCTAEATYKGQSQLEMFRKYELSKDDFRRISEECRKEGLIFFGTPTSIEWARFLVQDLGAPCVKIGSDDIVDHELIRGVARLGVPVILSRGMADNGELTTAVIEVDRAQARSINDSQAIMLHCTSLYPTPIEKIGLAALSLARECLWCPVGFSDHTDGSYAAPLAVAMGAVLVEKHFTLDRSLPGPDHHFSADQDIFADMVVAIRSVESAVDYNHRLVCHDWHMRPIARRSIVAARPCDVDTVLTIDMLAYKRAGKVGLLPYQARDILGKRLLVARDTDELILLSDVSA